LPTLYYPIVPRMNKSEGYERLAKLEQKQKDIKEKVEDLTREHKTTQQTLQRVSRQVIKLRPTRCSERIKLAVEHTTKPAKKNHDANDEGLVGDPHRLVELKKTQQDLEEQAEALSRELKDVQHALKTVSLQVITLTNELAPITSLPTEILVAIFAIFAEDYNIMPLGRVIRRWREIVNGTPQFWSTIQFFIRSYYRDSSKEEYRLNLALERSRQFPLDANFRFYGDDILSEWVEESNPLPTSLNDLARSFLARHLKALMPHACRIRSLTISMEWHGALYQILTAFQDVSAPLLERLVVYMPSLRGSDVVNDSPRPFVFLKGGAPMLKSIELRNLTIPHCSPPLQNVTHLSLTSSNRRSAMSIIEFGTMLGALTSLDSLRLGGQVFVADPQVTPTIAIPTLHSLYIASFYGHEPIDMRCFYLPILETLDINLFEISTSFPLPRFPKVRTLHVACISKGLSDNFPQVTDLHLSIIDTASAQLGDVHSWPFLRNLTVAEGKLTVLRSILNERIASDHPILTVSLTGSRATTVLLRRDFVKTDWSPNYKSRPGDPDTLHWQGKHGQHRSRIVTIGSVLTLSAHTG